MQPFRRRPSGEFEFGATSLRSETRLKIPASAPRHKPLYLTRYDRVRAVLLAYLSPILVDSVLDRAMLAHNFTPLTLNDAALSELTADIMVGLRLFVAETHLSRLMLELAEILEAEQP